MICYYLTHASSERMLLDLAYAWYVMVMYLACDTFMENHLTTLDCTFFLKLMPENQGHSGRSQGGGGGGTLIFSYIRRLGPFFLGSKF